MKISRACRGTPVNPAAPLLDVNVSLGRWPFLPLYPDTPARLDAHLRSESVDGALVSPVEAILFPDPEPWNRRLRDALKNRPALRPVPVVNPLLAGWRKTADRYLRDPAAPAVKVYPNYHLYTPDEPAFDELAELAAEHGRPILVQARVEDERNQYPLMRVPGVDVRGLAGLARRHPRTRFVCLNLYLGQVVALLSETDNTWADIACSETLDTLRSLLARVPAERLLFGSHTPFFTTRSAVEKIAGADVAAEDRRLVASGNARRLFGPDMPRVNPGQPGKPAGLNSRA